jgi:hypothetical protein
MMHDPHNLPIEGWAATEIFKVLEGLVQCDEPWFKAGPICEIGVHHGKFLVTAHNVLGGVRALGIDVFEDQARNVDGSGQGSMEAFLAGVNGYASCPGNISTWQMDSLELGHDDATRLKETIGKVKLFSVDGGHTAVHVINDVRFAEQVTAQDGIILIDDFCNPHWPGVNEGIGELFRSGAPRFAPFLYLQNKLFLCGLSFHARALASLDQALAPIRSTLDAKLVALYGYSALSCLRV